MEEEFNEIESMKYTAIHGVKPNHSKAKPVMPVMALHHHPNTKHF
jgi:hypothetical protein